MMANIDFAELNKERQQAAQDGLQTATDPYRLLQTSRPPLPVAPPEGCQTPQQEPAGLGAASSPAPGPVDYDAMLADVEAKAQRALQETTITSVSAVVDMGGVRFRLVWTRPRRWWQLS